MRYGDAPSIQQLKYDHTSLSQEHETLKIRYAELTATQELIKSKAKQLVAQNEDYSKIISQLNRYYYQLQDVRETMTTLQQQLWDADPRFEQQLGSIATSTTPIIENEVKKR